MPRRAGQRREKTYRRLGMRIAELRVLWERRHGERLTQEELARRVGLSSGYMSNIENGWSQVSTKHLKRIAAVLETDYNELARLAEYQDDAPDAEWIPPRDLVPLFRELAGGGRTAVEQAVAIVRTLQQAIDLDRREIRAREERRRRPEEEERPGAGGEDQPPGRSSQAR